MENSSKDWNTRWEYHLICHLRNLYAGQEATLRTGHGTTDWFQIGKGGLAAQVQPADAVKGVVPFVEEPIVAERRMKALAALAEAEGQA